MQCTMPCEQLSSLSLMAMIMKNIRNCLTMYRQIFQPKKNGKTHSEMREVPGIERITIPILRVTPHLKRKLQIYAQKQENFLKFQGSTLNVKDVHYEREF